MSDAEEKTDVERRHYIPGLAQFYFRPTFDWTAQQAEKLYRSRNKPVEGFGIDTIHYRDCIEAMKMIPEDSIDLIIADPPFGLDFTGKESIYNRNSSLVIDGYREANEYNQFTRNWIDQLPRIMKQDGTAYIFSGWTHLESVLRAARLAHMYLKNHLIWKYQFGVFTKKKYVTSHYHILMIVKDEENYFFNKIDHYPLDVVDDIPRRYRTGETKNGTVLPPEIIKRCIDFSSRPGDLVLDPFMGNGTTAVVAKRNFRHFLGFEINENLREVISQGINTAKVGEEYSKYLSRCPKPEDLKKKYPQAYREYLRRRKRGHKSGSR